MLKWLFKTDHFKNVDSFQNSINHITTLQDLFSTQAVIPIAQLSF